MNGGWHLARHNVLSGGAATETERWMRSPLPWMVRNQALTIAPVRPSVLQA
ncbi:MAG TPA: hypothetical protein VJQ59_00665 [Candidatus Sulfotelmatobacter sp.]|nr:hypothetical protein [Candidatus Sulfotelmatobacter sp.]